ncbi:hypothetical protein ACSD21_002049, partial [Escherichia coli]
TASAASDQSVTFLRIFLKARENTTKVASNRYSLRLWFFIITGSYRRFEPFRSSHYPVLFTLACSRRHS